MNLVLAKKINKWLVDMLNTNRYIELNHKNNLKILKKKDILDFIF